MLRQLLRNFLSSDGKIDPRGQCQTQLASHGVTARNNLYAGMA
ncbi:MAG: hypothetical protein ACRYE8_03750 [Janthinobacterium lividum]